MKIRLQRGAVGFGVLCAFCLVAAAKEYTLDELVKIGYENSRALRTVELEMKKAQSQIDAAIGSAAPKVDFTANYGYSLFRNVPARDTSGNGARLQAAYDLVAGTGGLDSLAAAHLRTLGPIISGISEGSASSDGTTAGDNSLSLVLGATQPLYAQGKVGIGLKIAKLNMAMLLCRFEEEKMNTRSGITALFYRSLIAQKNLEAIQQAVALAGDAHKITTYKLSLGNGTEIDTILSRMNLDKSALDLQKAGSDMRGTYGALILLCLLDEPAADFSVIGEIPTPRIDMELDAVLDKVGKNNRSLSQLRGAEEMQNQLVSMAVSDFFPMILASASFTESAGFNTFDQAKSSRYWRNNAGVGITVNINLFDGLRTNQKVRQAKTDKSKFLILKNQAEDAVVLQTKGTYDTLLNARTQLVVTENLVRLAEKSYSMTKAMYEVGMKTLLDLQNAELALKQAKISFNSALLSYNLAAINLQVLMGDY